MQETEELQSFLFRHLNPLGFFYLRTGGSKKETTQNYVCTVIVKKKRGIIGVAKSPELWGKHLVFSCPD